MNFLFKKIKFSYTKGETKDKSKVKNKITKKGGIKRAKGRTLSHYVKEGKKSPKYI